MEMPDGGDVVMRAVVAHQDRLYRYIYSLTPHPDDAKEVLQETCVALLRNVSAYDPDRDFLPWAYKFAQLEVLKHRERVVRSRRLFDPDVVELLARQRQLVDESLSAELSQLERCLQKLSVQDKQIVDARYATKLSADEVAERFRLSRRTLFRNLQRIRRLLMECITTALDEATT